MESRMSMIRSTVFCMIAATLVAAGEAAADRYTVRLEPALAAAIRETGLRGAGSGAAGSPHAPARLVLFFIGEDAALRPGTAPLDGPFFESPQPIASIAFEPPRDGAAGAIDAADPAWATFPCPLDGLEGRYRLQAIPDIDQTERAMAEGPGNLVSDVIEIALSEGEDDVEIELVRRIDRPAPFRGGPNLEWVELRSDLLSEFYGRDVFHRAGVALPNGYANDAGRRWPAVYVIPGFGGRHESARNYAAMLRGGHADYTPQAVFIVLDPESPLGHHGFVDNENHGPRGRALVSERIPHLES
jgi:hypothetical protein